MAETSPRTYNEKARSIVESSNYMVVATADKKYVPWAAAVLFVLDKEYNFYFLSAVDSRHAENIAENPNVSLVIFDSSTRIGLTDGVQIEGKASFVEGSGLKRVMEMYYNRVYPNSSVPMKNRYREGDYGPTAEFRFFKVKVVNAYVSGEDRRVRVELSKD